MNVSLHVNGEYWQARWTSSRGKRMGKSLGSRSKLSERQATVLCRQLQAKMQIMGEQGGYAPLLEKYIDRYLDNKPTYSKGTKELYQQTKRYMLGFFGNIRIDKITKVDAADFRGALARGELAHLNERVHKKPSEGTVCRVIREAKAIFQEAVEEDTLLRNPFKHLSSVSPKPDKEWATVTLWTLDKLMSACTTQSGKLFLALCRLAGLRQGEALRLKWSDVDFVKRRLAIVNPESYKTTKKKSREVPIEPRLFDLLERAARENEYICHGLPKGDHLHKWFHSLAEKAGIEPWARWCHTMRKNLETEWLNKYPASAVVTWLGHSGEVAQNHYYRVEDDLYEKAAGIATKIATN